MTRFALISHPQDSLESRAYPIKLDQHGQFVIGSVRDSLSLAVDLTPDQEAALRAKVATHSRAYLQVVE